MTVKVHACCGVVYPTPIDPRAGLWAIRTDTAGRPTQITVNCPCGCGEQRRLPLQPSNETEAWAMLGPRYAVTLYPGVSFSTNPALDDPHWTGWLIEGKWTSTRPAPVLRVIEGGRATKALPRAG